MALQKQAVSFNFALGLDLKTDKNQLTLGKFLELENAVFDKVGRLTKRNGFAYLPALPDATSSYLTTFNNGLVAIGKDIKSLSTGTNAWTKRGALTPISLSTIPLVKGTTNLTQIDATVSMNRLVLVSYAEEASLNATSPTYKYSILDLETGQTVVAPSVITPTFGSLTYPYSPRVFSLGNNFVVLFGTSSASTSHIQYFAINSKSLGVIGSATDFTTSYQPSQTSSTTSFDGVVTNDTLFVSWNGAANSGIKASTLNSFLVQGSTVVIASATASILSVTADKTQSTPVIWTSTYIVGSNSGIVVATNQSLSTLFSATQYVNSSSAKILNLASTAQNGVMTLNCEVSNSYSFSSSGGSNFINTLNAFQSGSLSGTSTLIRSLGLASKGFIVNSTSYVLGAFSSTYQPSYFLINSTGANVAKLAYSNGSGYITSVLPCATVASTTAYVGYLIKDIVTTANKDTNISSLTQIAQIYTTTGLNLASFKFDSKELSTSEFGLNLNVNGGMLYGYDGLRISEQGFHLYPDPVTATIVNGTSGGMIAQTYFYQSLYSWRDAKGNIFNSSPSIPVQVTGSGGNSNVTINVPTLRVTNKPGTDVKIKVYRWSSNQQNYYNISNQGYSATNSLTSDSVAILDAAQDPTILGNELLYTTGGVLENIGAPAADSVTVFDSRLWLVDSEDKNLLWYSKPVLENTPVEMSDLLTYFISPNAGAQGSTGPITSISPMDDKLIIFKKNAIYYINGNGPDITGANSQYSQPIFITGTVGCDNQNSIVMTPNGLMFQSDKGIWLLGRDLSTQYIGKDVDEFNTDEVLSALSVPGTNQVRFTLKSGAILMYDYFVGQWGTFSGVPGISSTLYEGLHSFINAQGLSYQESIGSYLDGSNPVLISFKTGFINLAGLQGYKRIYRMFLLGEYKTPHILQLGISYDYDENIQQLATIVPTNFSGTWGSSTTWGSVTRWGGSSAREQWQINFLRQQCQSFQISFNEYYDGSLGIPAGAGLTLSGIRITAGIKGTEPSNIPAKNKIS